MVSDFGALIAPMCMASRFTHASAFFATTVMSFSDISSRHSPWEQACGSPVRWLKASLPITVRRLRRRLTRVTRSRPRNAFASISSILLSSSSSTDRLVSVANASRASRPIRLRRKSTYVTRSSSDVRSGSLSNWRPAQSTDTVRRAAPPVSRQVHRRRQVETAWDEPRAQA